MKFGDVRQCHSLFISWEIRNGNGNIHTEISLIHSWSWNLNAPFHSRHRLLTHLTRILQWVQQMSQAKEMGNIGSRRRNQPSHMLTWPSWMTWSTGIFHVILSFFNWSKSSVYNYSVHISVWLLNIKTQSLHCRVKLLLFLHLCRIWV